MKQIHVVVTGFVQNVGFRKFVRHFAKKLGIVGWTRNLEDGTVEIVAVGEEEKLHYLLKRIERGPQLAQVDNVHTEWEDVQERFDKFVIRHL